MSLWAVGGYFSPSITWIMRTKLYQCNDYYCFATQPKGGGGERALGDEEETESKNREVSTFLANPK